MDLRKEVLYYDSFVDFPTNGQENKLYLDKANGALYYWDGSAYALAGDGSGGVTGVTASAPLASSGGAIPDITISQADSSTDGYLSYTDWNTFNGKLTTVSTDGSSITGDGTPGNPLEATGSSSSPTVQVVLFADLATTERLNPCTYSNGTLGVGATLTGSSNGQLSTISFSGKIDNVSTALNQTIIVSQQYDKRQNGLYVVTQLGDASNPFILTRSADSDTQAEMYPLQINTYGGATLSNRAFLQKTVDPVIGTDNIVFTTSTIGIQTSNLNFVDTVTSAALPSCTYTSGTNPTVPGSGARLTATANGSIGTINGITLALNNRILVKDQANQAHNGDYSVTQVGSASTPFILTRVSAWGGEFPRLVREWKVNNPSSSKYGARYSTNLSSLSNTNVGVTAISFYEVIVKDSDLSLSDITTNDVSTSKHGFVPKAPNDTTKFLRGDGTWAVPSSGGLTKFTEAENTSAPNTTVYVDSLTAAASTTNADAAIVPKGTGAILAAIPDNTATGGNKRGANAVDLQTYRTTNDRVASGQYSTVIGGGNSRATAQYAIAGGNTGIAGGTSSTALQGGTTNATQAFAHGTNTASGAGSTALGGSVTYGYSTASGEASFAGHNGTASGAGSFAFGEQVTSNGVNSQAWGFRTITKNIYAATVVGSGHTTAGDGQKLTVALTARTTGNTATTLTVRGLSVSDVYILSLLNNSASRFKGTIIGKKSGTTDVAAWDIDGLIVRGANAASTTLVVSNVNVVDNTPAWGTPTLAADTTNGGLQVQVTGATSTNIQWTAIIDSIETLYA